MPDHSQDDSADGESGVSLWLWSLLGVFAACMPCALLVVEKLGSALSLVPLILAVLAALAGYVVAVRVVVGEKFGQRSRRSRILVWLAAGGLFVGSVAVLFAFRPPPPPLARMSGARDVAVVGFAGHDGRQDKRVLTDVAADFAHAMAGRIPTATAVRSYADEVSLPLAELQGTHRSRLEGKTARFADESNAEIVVAGLVSTDPAGQTTLRPAVYVRADQIPDSPELVGWFLSGPILMARGWESARGRAELSAELTRRIGTLAEFVDALDTWRNGSPAEAARILKGLLGPKRQGGTDDFVPPDLVRLFHGHAAEDQALGETGPARQALLEEARADYLAISEDSPAGRRAALGLQGNAYRRALGPAHNCKPGTVRSGELAQISQALGALAKDRELTELGQLKATVNLAQVEQCRITAGLVTDDGTVERAVATVRAAPDTTGSAALHAFAESIAAIHAYGRGDLAAAIKHIRAAIAHGQDLVQRAVWHGLLASWSLARCDLETGRTAQQDALNQLAAAEQAGRASTKLRRQIEQAFAAELRQAEERCGAVR
ncbi:hypothetical protein GCM10011579_019750 [Streptomyces albiflavescens]|uniref:Uncharacterized protein n=1 Tax=Streptomyces albiflavescens TaxID=1623582 RepID=A0A918D1U6_9ACTN|nr:hypothetical protein [Streptomyces albiflavescens]GGN57462.1 hypothetical protein GCM10011579_019750 [Streptomyces albiflavescens]